MSAHASATVSTKDGAWTGGKVPLGAPYGKLMMWFFLLSDAFTFSSLLVSYGYFRTTVKPGWVNPEHVFQGIPWLVEGNHTGEGALVMPLIFVGIMTFILIFSSVTMVLAVESGHNMNKKGVQRYMILTIIGGLLFLICQAMEWSNLIIKEGMTINHNPFPAWVDGKEIHENASILFGQLFYGITGFHGFHVFSGVVINCIILVMTYKGVFQRRGHYEMVEKVGLYWHFVDLVWVFVFTLFYLI
jgi:cytochrome c oxidase subunit 3